MDSVVYSDMLRPELLVNWPEDVCFAVLASIAFVSIQDWHSEMKADDNDS